MFKALIASKNLKKSLEIVETYYTRFEGFVFHNFVNFEETYSYMDLGRFGKALIPNSSFMNYQLANGTRTGIFAKLRHRYPLDYQNDWSIPFQYGQLLNFDQHLPDAYDLILNRQNCDKFQTFKKEFENECLIATQYAKSSNDFELKKKFAAIVKKYLCLINIIQLYKIKIQN